MAVLNNPIAIWGSDLNFGIYNPALLNPKMKDGLALNFVDYFSDINMVSAAYAFPFNGGRNGWCIYTIFKLRKVYIPNEQAEELGFFSSKRTIA